MLSMFATNTIVTLFGNARTCRALQLGFCCFAGDVGPLMHGILAGLVSVSAAAAVVNSYEAVIIGAVGGVVCVVKPHPENTGLICVALHSLHLGNFMSTAAQCERSVVD